MSNPEVRTIPFGAPELKAIKPGSVRTFFASTEAGLQIHPGIPQALRELGGRHLIAAVGYGSSFNGESTNSLQDYLLFIYNVSAFHQENKKKRPQDYDPITGNPKVQTWLNGITPNFYPSKLDLDGQEVPIKYGVVSLDQVRALRTGLEQSDSNFYLRGRLEKAIILPFVPAANPIRQKLIERAITQARIDGMWLATGLLPDEFSCEELALTYIGLSYRADVRAEKPDKIRILLTQSPDEYKAMLGDLLKAFIDFEFLEQVDDGVYRKRVSMKEEDVKKMLSSAAWFAFKANYVKNPLTYGPIRGIQYGWGKYLKGHPGLADFLYPQRQTPEIQLKEGIQLDEAVLRRIGEELESQLRSKRNRRP